ncbi:PASTA domain-containing protein [Nocardioides speluncae]|uniref:PASTA domain-containing protein n=1 Tax=Nocardioides speluncae TaxID=2670337 RepID=UPI0012B16864|nr:PASTA domain-containing protein [Nocardioides speluncae]
MPDVCPDCGGQIEPRAEFCDSCGVYVGWDQTRIGTRIHPVRPSPEAVGRQPAEERRPADRPPVGKVTTGLAMQVSDTHLDVAPGEVGIFEVIVRNTGSLVEQFVVRVGGEAAFFATVSVPQLQVYPGNEARTQVTFAPPRAVQPNAGSHRWIVEVASTVSPERDQIEGTVTVAGFADVAAALDPARTKGRGTRFNNSLRLENRGNALVQVFASPDDPTREIGFRGGATATALAPGQMATETLTGQTKRSWFGAPQTLPFTVDVRTSLSGTPYTSGPPDGGPTHAAGAWAGTAQPGQADTQTLTGTRIQKPVFPRWLPVAVIALIGLIVAAVMYFTGAETAAVPAVAGDPQAEAVEKIEAAGLEADVEREKSEDVKAGLVTRTDPAADTDVEVGETVKVFVSSGPEGKAPVVPALVGLTADEAEQALDDVGLEARRTEPIFDDAVPAGQVIRSAPEAGTTLARGETVALVISKGPKEDGGDGGGPIVVPDVGGLSGADAEDLLEDTGFTEVDTREVAHNEVPSGDAIGTDPADGTEAVGDDPITLLVSTGPTTPFDLAEAAEDATWSTETGEIDFGDDSDPTRGLALLTSDNLEDGTPASDDLRMHPEEVPGGVVAGEFELPAALIDGDLLIARVGFLADGPGTADVVIEAVMPDGETLELVRASVDGTDGIVREFSADLSDGAGAEVIRIVVDSVESTQFGDAVLVDPVLTGTPEE